MENIFWNYFASFNCWGFDIYGRTDEEEGVDETFESFLRGEVSITDFSRDFVTSSLYYVVLEMSKQVIWLRGVLAPHPSGGGGGGGGAAEAAVPLVYFDNGRRRIVLPMLSTEEQLGEGLCCRLQLPLGLGYALTGTEL